MILVSTHRVAGAHRISFIKALTSAPVRTKHTHYHYESRLSRDNRDGCAPGDCGNNSKKLELSLACELSLSLATAVDVLSGVLCYF